MSAGSWRGEFTEAYKAGRFKAAGAIFDAHAASSERPELVLLAARAHMHYDPAASLRLLLKLRSPATKSVTKVERDMLLTEAFARTKDFTSADQCLMAALSAAQKLKDAELVSAVGYRGVRRYLLSREPAKARTYLDFTRAAYSKSSRLYSAYAEAIILGYEERVLEQAERLTEVLRLLDPNSGDFIELRAWSTHTLAALARELYIPAAISEIDRQLSGKPWPKDFAPNLFQALRGVGWAKALLGDSFNAFRHLKRASEVADTTAWKVVAACDRSYLARSLGEPRWSRSELDEAEQLAAVVDWHSTLAEERMGLLALAELFGSLDTARSAMYLARYRELGELKSPLYYGEDPRRTAYAQYSTGVVEIALGNTRRGLTELREARKVFERFGYDFRVARCILAEYAVSGKRELVPILDEKLRNYRMSWLMNEVRSLSGSTQVSLPPMQRRVFDEICQGKSTAEISRTLGRSAYTISNHTKAIFKAFGVKSRAALLAEAMQRGHLTRSRDDGAAQSLMGTVASRDHGE